MAELATLAQAPTPTPCSTWQKRDNGRWNRWSRMLERCWQQLRGTTCLRVLHAAFLARRSTIVQKAFRLALTMLR